MDCPSPKKSSRIHLAALNSLPVGAIIESDVRGVGVDCIRQRSFSAIDILSPLVALAVPVGKGSLWLNVLAGEASYADT